jgi:hypothetical protein
VVVSLLAAAIVLFAAQSHAGDPQLLNGFEKETAGEHIDYHSFHPYASGALLTRCLDGKQVIAWRTEPIPESFTSERATFAWIGGHSTGSSEADAAFTLSVNGEPVLRFTTARNRRVWNWRAEGARGVSLAFEGRWEDSVNDLFGYFFLTVPVGTYGKGKPLAVSIVGDSVNRRDWYMTFKYQMKESVVVQSQPALLRNPEGNRQLIDVLIDHVQQGGSVDLSTSLGDRMHATLQLGYNTLQLPVTAVREVREVGVEISIDGQAARQEKLLLHPVRFREFWVLPHSHNDIGYSDLQSDVEKKQLKNLRDAIALWKMTAGYPPEARFKWNTEILWAVDRFFATGTEGEKEEFIATVKEGGIGLNALYANQLTGICRPEELLRLTDFARSLVSRYGVKVNDAMMTDIPGFTWATVPALALGGVKYFSSGPNFIPSLPDGGDRVGHFNRTWGDRPFYWISPSGQEKVLFWVAGKGYSWFHGWILGKMGERTGWNLLQYLKDLDAQDYPYDMIQLRYTIGGDNGPTDADLPDFVRRWNERYASPKLVISTASAMFEEFERRWGTTVPSFSGDVTPYWEDGALSTLRELGSVRQSTERLIQAEAVACITGVGRLDERRVEDAWRNVHLFDEHTWGAWNSVSDPDNSFARSQWEVKRRYATDLEMQSGALLRDALSSSSGSWLEVVNTLSWNRSDLVCIGGEISQPGDIVVDGGGREVPSQRLSTGELAFIARDVPALGSRRYAIRPGKSRAARSVQVQGSRVASAGVTVELDPQTGAIRRLAAPGGREYADTSVYPGLNQYLYVPGRDPSAARQSGGATISVKEAGPLLCVLRILSDAPGCKGLDQEVRIVDGLQKVEIVDRLDKAQVREKEAVHIAFPFSVPQGEFRLDGGWGVVRPGADQLPGSCKDYLPAGRWVDYSNQECGITLTLGESPLVEIGAMTDERPGPRGVRLWKTAISSGAVCYSYVMNNYWHTNYAADQHGVATLHYALYPHGVFNAAEAYRRGVEQSQPLLIRAGGATGKALRSLFTLSSPGVVVTSLKRSADGKATMVRLYAAGGKPEEFSLRWDRLKSKRVFRSSLREESAAPASRTLSLPAYGILTLRCEE